jgi:hypothetical protein
LDVDAAMTLFRTILAVAVAYGPASAWAQDQDQPVRILGVEISLTASCDLEIRGKDGKSEIIRTNLPKLKHCEFLNWAGTNVVNLNVVRQHYVLLVQSRDIRDPSDPIGCTTKYRAVSVSRTEKVRVGAKLAGGKACEADHERSEVEYLSRDIVR